MTGLLKRVGCAIAVLACAGVSILALLVCALLYGGSYDSDGPRTGWIAIWLGDVDGDGVSDIALKTAFEPARRYGGVVRILSGATGTTLKTFEGVGSNAQLHEELGAAGDLDGDGRNEIWWGFEYDTLSVGSASEKGAKFELKVDLCAKCVPLEHDVDGDGVQDLAVTRFPVLRGERKALTLVSGRTGSALWTIDGPEMSEPLYAGFGDDLCRVADLDGDSAPDLAVLDEAERIQLVSGRSGVRLHTLPLRVSSSGATEDLGDLDGDGHSELLIYSGWGGFEDWTDGEPPRNPIQVVSTKDGRVLSSIPCEPVLWNVHSPGDVDGDGRRDIAWTNDGVNVVSGSDGRSLHKVEGIASRGQADWNSDGCADLLVTHNIYLEVGEQWPSDLWRKGRIEIVSGKDGTTLRTFDQSVLPPDS